MGTGVEFPKLGLLIEVDPVAFKIGSFSVYWYGLLIGLGAVIGFLTATYLAGKYYKLDKDKFIDVVIAGLIFGIIGARLYYVAFNFDRYSGDIASVFDIRSGGLAIYGGIIGAFLAGFVTCKIRGLSVPAVFDLAAVGFAFGQGVGRWGNFINQEAFGRNTGLPWGMYSVETYEYLNRNYDAITATGTAVYPNDPVHPCFLYESCWCLLAFVIMLFMVRRRRYDGQLVLFYGAWYGFGRCIIEGLRTDSLMIGGIRVSQALSAVLCVVCAALLAVNAVRRKSALAADGAAAPEQEDDGGEADTDSPEQENDGGEADTDAPEQTDAADRNEEV